MVVPHLVAYLNVFANALFIPILGPVIHLTTTTPGRLLSHCANSRARANRCSPVRPFSRRLTRRRGTFASGDVWGNRRPNAFDGATQLDSTDSGEIDLLDFDRPCRSVAELDELLRRRINRRLVTWPA